MQYFIKEERLDWRRANNKKFDYKPISVKTNERVDSYFYGNICIGVLPDIIDILKGN